MRRPPGSGLRRGNPKALHLKRSRQKKQLPRRVSRLHRKHRTNYQPGKNRSASQGSAIQHVKRNHSGRREMQTTGEEKARHAPTGRVYPHGNRRQTKQPRNLINQYAPIATGEAALPTESGTSTKTGSPARHPEITTGSHRSQPSGKTTVHRVTVHLPEAGIGSGPMSANSGMRGARAPGHPDPRMKACA